MLASKLEKLESKRIILRFSVTKLENKTLKKLEIETLDFQELKISKSQLFEKQTQLEEINSQIEEVLTDLGE